MNNKRFPYALIAVALFVMLLYPRAIPSGAPAVLRTDLVIGFVYGICLGVEILGLVMSKRQQQQR